MSRSEARSRPASVAKKTDRGAPRSVPCRETGIERVVKPVPGQIERENDERDRESRSKGRPKIGEQVPIAIRQHRSPLRGRWLRAQSEKAEPRGFNNCSADPERSLHDERRGGIRYDRAQEDPPRACADRSGRRDVLGLL